MQPHDTKDQSPDEIAAALDRQRASLSSSIEGLRGSLSVDALIGDALRYARDQSSPCTRALDGAIRANPLAAVMAGVGLAWLVLGRKGGAPTPEPPLAGTRFEALSRWEDEGGPTAPLPDDDIGWIPEADALRDRATGALAAIDAAMRHKLRPAAELALERTRVIAELATATRVAMLRGLDGLTSDARERILATRERAYAARLAAVRQGTKLIEERPVLAGAIGMAIGAVVAAALPRTKAEDRLFGSDRDRLMARAQETLEHERARVAASAAQLAESVAADVKDRARGLVAEPV